MQCKVVAAFFEILDVIVSERKNPRDYGTGHLLFHAEVNFLDAVHTNPAANVSELAEILGVTKSAVTQISDKLCRKGLVERYFEPGNKKERYYSLTASGELARSGHKQYHEEANGRMRAYLHSLEADEQEVIMRFLGTLRDCMPFCVYECCGQGKACTCVTDAKEMSNA